MLLKLFRDVYKTGVIPNDNKVNKTLTVPGKLGADKCKNYRTIGLTTYAFRILTRICRRIEQTIEISFNEN